MVALAAKINNKMIGDKMIKRHSGLFLCIAWVLMAAFAFAVPTSAAEEWLQFRGPQGNSHAENASVPVEWSTESGRNIAWKAEVPGRGPSSPILVDDRVIVTSSSGPNQQRLHVLAFDAGSGATLWHRKFWATGRTMTHPTSSVAAPTPASDGERIFALFSSCDVICLDLDGNLQWLRGLAVDYPKAGNDVGMSSSPVVAGDVVVVQLEAQNDAFVEAIDRRYGESRWHLDRKRKQVWSSPVVVEGGQDIGETVVLQSLDTISGHDPRHGEMIWSLSTSCDSISSPSGVDGRLFVPANGITAIVPNPKSGSAEVLWRENRLQPGAASAVVHKSRVFAINSAGVLTCAEADSGDIAWRLRLKGSFWATPIAVGKYVYASNDAGLVQVVEIDGEKGHVVAENDLGEKLQASPAVASNAIFYRSDQHLWKIAHDDNAAGG